MNKTTLAAIALACATVITTSAILTAGPLSPPAGAVAPTYKTLTEVEPRIAINAVNTPGDAGSLFIISQPGSYYLTGNITGVAGKHGIVIPTGGVSLDLGGFVLQGVPGSLSGITTVVFQEDIRVERGTVRNWGGSGVAVFGDNSILRDLILTRNGGPGIDAGGAFHPRIEGCVAMFNGAVDPRPSIIGGVGSVITGCSVRGSFGAGISVGAGGRAESCTVVASSAAGILVAIGAVVSDCVVAGNGSNAALPADQRAGILVTSSRARVENNTISGSGGPGIRLAVAGNFVTRNALAGNAGGSISAVAGNWVAPIVPAAGAAANTNGNANLEN